MLLNNSALFAKSKNPREYGDVRTANLHRGNAAKKLRTIETLDAAIKSRGWAKGESYAYKGGHTHVSLLCDQGHEVLITPSRFIHSGTCAQCTRRCPIQARRVFESAVVLRGWQKSEGYNYISTRIKVALVCPKGHSTAIAPSDFKAGHGCVKCADRCTIQSAEQMTTALALRGWKKGADYVYKNTKNKVSVVCNRGHSVAITPEHFKIGNGCSVCANKCAIQAAQQMTAALTLRGWHKGAAYEYKGSKRKVSVVCDKGHALSICPDAFKRGVGCATCSKKGFDPAKPATLYYVAFFPAPDRIVYKVGITNNTVAQRYVSCKTPREIIWEYHFDVGADAQATEQEIIHKYNGYLCKDKPIKGLSNTELFDKDILPRVCYVRTFACPTRQR